MAVRAQLIPSPVEAPEWPWHKLESTIVPASALTAGERRMEAAAHMTPGARLRVAVEMQKRGWCKLSKLARIWQPSRLKGILVSPEHGTPFLAATQVFDVRPTPRKWLAVERTPEALDRFVEQGTILVTCSGSVGIATVAHHPHVGRLISHDLLRVDVGDPDMWGWVYATLRTAEARLMLSAAEYGHMIKHLEVAHLDRLPVPILRHERREDFNSVAKKVFRMRDEAHQLLDGAEALFQRVMGNPVRTADPEAGFATTMSALRSGRRRVDASFHSPNVAAILARLEDAGRSVKPVAEVTERVWWLNRFRRVMGASGIPYLSAEELFTVNPVVSKRVMVEQVLDPEAFVVQSGWLVMARSGQVYGTLGNVALTTARHAKAFLSDDLIRMIPKASVIRPGYLHLALTHPTLGRPLVIRHAYGTSIPHLDPADVASVPIVRLSSTVEVKIADAVERAIELRAAADELEDHLAADAAAVYGRLSTGDLSDLER